MVIGGNLNTYVISGLRALTEYEVTLAAIYKDKAESENVVLSETTGYLISYTALHSSQKCQEIARLSS